MEKGRISSIFPILLCRQEVDCTIRNVGIIKILGAKLRNLDQFHKSEYLSIKISQYIMEIILYGQT